MANQVNAELNLTDNGSIKNISEQLAKVQEQLATIKSTSTATGAAGMAAANKAVGGIAAPVDTQGRVYDVARAGAGATGSATSDFAAQAQGLSGLVHVYATFAANIYAIGTAFNALKDAMNVSNMIQGLDTMGAASGKNLTNIAKQMQETTKGALDMQQALKETALGSAAGISGESMVKLSAIAAKASVALGIDIPEAMHRLTLAADKSQPKLVQQMGIILNAKEVYAQYAASVGKTTSSLTDLEKQQAFTTALIEQGNKAYAGISDNVNQYAIILAKAKDIAVSALMELNKVLSPIINLLSSSPTALAGAMAAIGTVLLNQAIPALSKWQSAMEKNAERSRQQAQQMAADFETLQNKQLETLKSTVEAELAVQTEGYEKAFAAQKSALTDQLKAQQAAEAASLASQKEAQESFALYTQQGVKSKTGVIAAIAQKPLSDITEQDIALLNSRAKALETTALNTEKDTEAIELQAMSLREAVAQVEKYNQAILDTEMAQKGAVETTLQMAVITEDIAKKRVAAEQQVTEAVKVRQLQEASAFSELSQRQAIAEKNMLASQRASALSGLGQNVQTQGIAGAWNTYTADMAKAREAGGVMNTIKNFGTDIKAGFITAATAVSTFIQAFSGWILGISLAITALSALLSWLSNNEKEVAAFKDSIENLDSSIQNVGRTLDTINKKPILEQLSIQSVGAKSEALDELTASIIKSVDAVEVAFTKASNTDKLVDSFKSIWGGDLQSIAAKGVSDAITSALSLDIENLPATTKFKSEIQAIFKTTDISQTGISTAMSKLTQPEAIVAMDKLKAAFKEFDEQAKKMPSSLTEFKKTLEDTDLQVDQFLSSLAPSDLMSRLGQETLKMSADISKAIKEGPVNSILALQAAAHNVSLLSIIPEDSKDQLMGMSKDIDSTAESIAKATKAVQDFSKEIANLKAQQEALAKAPKAYAGSSMRADAIGDTDSQRQTKLDAIGKQITSAQAGFTEAQANLAKARADEARLATELPNLYAAAFDRGAQLIGDALHRSSEMAALSIEKAAASGLQGVGAAQANLDITLKEIDVTESQIKTELELIDSNFAVKIALEANSAALKETSLRSEQFDLKKLDPSKLTSAQEQRIKEIDQQLSYLKITQDSLKQVANITKESGGNIQKLLDAAKKAGAGGDTNVQSEVQQYAFARAGLQAKADQEHAKAVIATNAAEIAGMKEQLALKIELNNQQLSSNALSLSDLETRNKFGAVAQEDYINQKADLDISTKRIQLNSTMLTDASAINVQYKLQEQSGHEIAGTQDLINKYVKDYKDGMIGINQLEAARAAQLEQIAFQQSQALKTQQITTQLGTHEITRAQADLQTYDLQIAALERIKQLQLDAAKATLDKTGDTVQYDKSTAAIEKQFQYGKQLEDQKKKLIDYNTRLADQMDDQNRAMVEMNRLLGLTTSIADALGKAFGAVGTSLGGITSALAKNAQDQLKIQQDLIKTKLENDTKYGKDSQAAIEANTTAEKEAAADRTDANLTADSNILQSAASMFDKKTAASKAFTDLEKALAIVRIAMDAEETAAALANDAKLLVSNLEQIGSNIATGASKFFAQSGWWGFAGVAAMLAVMAGLGFQGHGGGSGGPSGADIQKIQGTGQAYNAQGQIVNTAGGALGDPTAISKSIADSTALVAKYTFQQLGYSDKMLTALQDLTQSLTGVTTSLINTPGLISQSLGSAFGTQIGSSDTSRSLGNLVFGGGLFGGSKSTSITGSGISIAGSLQQLIQGIGQEYQTQQTTTKSSGGLFGILGSSTDISNQQMALSSTTTKAIGAVFQSLSDSLLAAGEQIGLSADSLEKSLSSATVKITADLQNLTGQALTDAINAVFSQAMDEITAQVLPIVQAYQLPGETLTDTAIRVANDSRDIGIELASIGQSMYKPVSAFKDVTNTITTTTNAATGALNKLNTSMNSVTTTTTTVTTAQDQAVAANLALNESMVKLFGSLDQFNSETQFYQQNFLTTAQQNAIVQQNVTQTMAALGESSVTTREQFANLVSSLDLTTAQGQSMYKALMDIAPAFAQVTAEVTKTMSATDIATTRQSDLLAIEMLLTDSAGQLALQRQNELAQLDDSLKPQRLYLYALQDEAKAKADLATAYDNESKALQSNIDSLTQASTALKNYGNSLALGSQSPLTPAQKYAEAQSQFQSILQAAQTNVTANQTTQPTLFAQQTAAQQQALGQLQGAASALLTASAAYNASSPAYTKDYNMVQSALTATAGSLDSQVSLQQQQLDQLTATVSQLTTINTSVMSVTDAINELKAAMLEVNTTAAASGGPTTITGSSTYVNASGNVVTTGLPQQSTISSVLAGITTSPTSVPTVSSVFKSTTDTSVSPTSLPSVYIKPKGLYTGGIGNGLTWVGENGPELVNFDKPTNVYNNSQSQGMMGNVIQPLVDQIKSLQDEVAQLRAESKEHTGNIIASNYDANATAASMVATVISEEKASAAYNNKLRIKSK